VLERGNIYFFYVPRVQEEAPQGIEEIQRFYMVLSPQGAQRHRLIVVGRKKLPEIKDGGERTWAFVDKVATRPEEVEQELERVAYPTKTRGARERPPARPAGEGVYALVWHGDHTHLAFSLELPWKPGQVQRELDIPEEGSYIISVKNPEQPSPPWAGLQPERKAELPKHLQERFRGRRFIDPNPPDFLNYEGAELLLIGAAADVKAELGIDLDPQRETERTAEIFRQLKLERDEHPVEPLFTGEWR
jgi:hypothetical protein